MGERLILMRNGVRRKPGTYAVREEKEYISGKTESVVGSVNYHQGDQGKEA